MRKSIFILAISLLLPFVCCAQDSSKSKSDNEKIAFEWTKIIAEEGDAPSQMSLGFYYYEGEIVAQDYKQAIYWWKKAAEQGHIEAQFVLGRFYENGEGVAKDLKQAAYWYRKAADQGHEKAKEALENLGL